MTIVAWRDFYIMGGAALATLLGLLFVAMSLHLKEILAVRPLTRNLEVALYGVVFQLVFCGFMLVPNVTLVEVGAVILVAAVVFALFSIRFATFRGRFDTMVNVSFALLAAPVGVALMLGWAGGLYVYAAIFGLTVASLIRLCWRLLTMAMTGLRESEAAPRGADRLRTAS
ncbi:MAG TPA: hypothetical protein VFL29_04405 [Candidatus Dormibacteraeota bacterium]|nr:hypothetical protein [Candidatus Dormibacteraeota bacterium]